MNHFIGVILSETKDPNQGEMRNLYPISFRLGILRSEDVAQDDTPEGSPSLSTLQSTRMGYFKAVVL